MSLEIRFSIDLRTYERQLAQIAAIQRGMGTTAGQMEQAAGEFDEAGRRLSKVQRERRAINRSLLSRGRPRRRRRGRR